MFISDLPEQQNCCTNLVLHFLFQLIIYVHSNNKILFTNKEQTVTKGNDEFS